MLPFPDRDQLSFLLGAELSQIILSRYNIDLRFQSCAAITVEHRLAFIDVNGNNYDYDIQSGVAAIHFASLIGQSISSFERSDWSLGLLFQDGNRLKISSIVGEFESGQLSDGKSYFVF